MKISSQEELRVNSAFTDVIFGEDARRQLFKGLDVAAQAVMTTLGPKGKTVLIQKGDGAPIVTKDGVSVSKAIKLKNPIMRMGADLIKEAASHTNEIAGDGTTTATVLTHAMVKEVLKLLMAGVSAKELCTGISFGASLVDDMLVKIAKQVTTTEEISQVGTISANGDKSVGDLIAKAMEKVGKDGIITVEDAKGMQTSLSIAEGVQIDRGYLSPYFVNDNDKMHSLYRDAFVLITDKKISSLKDIVPILEQVNNARKPLLIIADDVEGEALQGLVLNRVKANLQVCAIKAPGYGQHKIELLNDLCTLTGAKLVSSMVGFDFKDVKLNLAESGFGNVKKFVVDAKNTTLVATGATKKNIDERIIELTNQLNDVTISQEQIIKLKNRIAKLANGVAVIKVGGATELEMIELKYRIEDALNATKAAAEQGIVSGGGTALLNISEEIKKIVKDASDQCEEKVAERFGIDVVLKALIAPVTKIAENAGVSASTIINDIRRANSGHEHGYNAATGEYVNMIEAGIIDPVKVTRAAVKNAASVAVTFATLDAVIVDEEEK